MKPLIRSFLIYVFCGLTLAGCIKDEPKLEATKEKVLCEYNDKECHRINTSWGGVKNYTTYKEICYDGIVWVRFEGGYDSWGGVKIQKNGKPQLCDDQT